MLKKWNTMSIFTIELYSIVLICTVILLASVFYPENAKATILSGIDEPKGNAYEDVYIADDEQNATNTSDSNQTTMNTNSTKTQ